MPTRTDLVTLAQWLSPNFPIGAFAYSHGLEAAVEEGWVRDAESLQDWLAIALEEGSGRSDAIWLRLAHGAKNEAALLTLNAEARAFMPAKERLVEAERQGAAFSATVRSVWQSALPDLLLPLAVGASSAQAEMQVDLVVPLYLHAFTSNLVAAAQRLMPLGQTEAQKVLAALTPICEAVADGTKAAEMSDIHSNAFLSDIAAMRHEQMEPRIFQS